MNSFSNNFYNQKSNSKKEIDIDLSFLESEYNLNGGNYTDSNISLNTSDFINTRQTTNNNTNHMNYTNMTETENMTENMTNTSDMNYEYNPNYSATSDIFTKNKVLYGGFDDATSDISFMVNTNVSATSDNSLNKKYNFDNDTMTSDSIFKHNNQDGGGEIMTEFNLSSIISTAKEYISQKGGKPDIDDDDDDDDDLDDDDEEDSSDKKKSDSSSVKKKQSRHNKRSVLKEKAKSKSKSKNYSDSIASVEGSETNTYKINSSESFGNSKSDTPYMNESSSINTSSINLVSFENPALTKQKKYR